MHIGIVTMAIGLVIVDLVMRSASGGVNAWELAGPLAITGFGMGMVFVPMFDVILAGVAPHELGSASGLLESVQQLAMSLGIAAVGTALFDHLGSGHGPAAFVGAADHALLMAVAFLIAAVRGRLLAAQARAGGALAAPSGERRAAPHAAPEAGLSLRGDRWVAVAYSNGSRAQSGGAGSVGCGDRRSGPGARPLRVHPCVESADGSSSARDPPRV